MNNVIPMPTASISIANSLDEIATKIRQVQANNIIEIGELLTIAKAKLKHGNFHAWVERELNIKARSATNYMAYAAFLRGKSATVADLPPHVVYKLAAPSARRNWWLK